MRQRLQLVLIVILLAIVIVPRACSKKPPSQEQREQAFREMMNGVTLAGRSSRLHDDKIVGEERYVIQGVTKLGGDTWLLRSRMQYAGSDIPLPIPVQIEWAGDTPVITLTDFAIPGMGTYTARVVLYRGQYAGTWSGKTDGGQLFGKIVRTQ